MSAAQGTQEWLIERCGYTTVSNLKKVIAKGRSGEASTRRDYRIQCVTERLTKLPVEGYKNAAMQWGNDTEPLAREHLAAEYGIIVECVGFTKHPRIEWLGASPDGLIDSLPEKFGKQAGSGGVEIKCPANSTVHIETILAEEMPPEHIPQVQGSMWVTDRQWWIFVSFDPRMPEGLKLYAQLIERDDDYIQNVLVPETTLFLKQTEQEYQRLLALELSRRS